MLFRVCGYGNAVNEGGAAGGGGSDTAMHPIIFPLRLSPRVT